VTWLWLGIVFCQIGVAFAARTGHASLRSVGFFGHRLLLVGIGVAPVLAAGVVYLPFAHSMSGTAALNPAQAATVLPFPFPVRGADEMRRVRRRSCSDMEEGARRCTSVTSSYG
jgi:magnesium-transporting ATPase (P-type)